MTGKGREAPMSHFAAFCYLTSFSSCRQLQTCVNGVIIFRPFR